MAYGLPVVATGVGGIPEAVADGITGYLVSPGDVDALTYRLRELLSSEALRRRMGEAGRARVQACFSIEVIGPRLAELYLGIVRGTCSGRGIARGDEGN